MHHTLQLGGAPYGIGWTEFLLLDSPGEVQGSVEEGLTIDESLRLDRVNVTEEIRIHPHTPLKYAALREGMIAPNGELLFTRFSLTPGLVLPAARTVSGTVGVSTSTRDGPRWSSVLLPASALPAPAQSVSPPIQVAWVGAPKRHGEG